ncbi:hypothetical protein KJZ61_04300 [Candidatus Dependentiae bacterium]|nr:hypothetical protein [Candidatus Dependentiae bacterium]
MKRFLYQEISYKIILCSLIYTNGTHSQPTNVSDQNEPDDIVITVIATGQQNTTVQQPEKRCSSCHGLFGTQLKECMHYLQDDDFKNQFFSMHPRARYLYLMSIDISEYNSLLKRFNEQEWRTYRDALAPTEKEYLPETLEEQYAVIKKTPDLPHYYKARFDCFWRFYEPDNKYCLAKARGEHYQSLKESLLQKYHHVNESDPDTKEQS